MLLDRLLGATAMPLLERAAVFAERRQDVLSGNIANISTPGYKTRDLPTEQFQAALREALTRVQPQGETGQTPTWSFEQPLDQTQLAELFPASVFQAQNIAGSTPTFQDGGNRGVESELMELTKNSMMQTMAIELMGSQINKLQMVLSERV